MDMLNQLRYNARLFWFFVRHGAEIRKAHPAGDLALYRATTDGKQPKAPDVDSALKAAEIDVWVASAVGTIAKAVHEAPLVLETEKRAAGETRWERVETGDLAELVERPNPRETMAAQSWKIVASMLLHGNGYQLHDPDTNELWHNRSDWVTAIGLPDGSIGAYEIKNDSAVSKTLPAAQVIHHAIPNPLSNWYGANSVKPIKTSILTNYFYERYVQGFFEGGAVPGGLISTQKKVGKPAREEAREEWNRLHSNKEDAHRTAFLGEGYTYETISPPLKDLAVEVLTSVTRERILAAFQLPPVLAGVYEYANYANANQQIKIFWMNVVLPIIRLLEGVYNAQLVPLYIERSPRNERLRIRHQTEKIMALQEDKLEEADRATKIYQGGIAKLDEAREIVGLEKIGEAEGGDQFYVPPAGIMIGPNGEKMFGGGPYVQTVSPYLSEYNNFLKSAVTAERRLRTYWNEYLSDQLQRLIDRIYTLTGEGKSINALLARIQTKDNDFLPPNIDSIFNADDENLKLLEELGPLTFELVEENGQEALGRFGITYAFDVKAPIAEAFRNGMVNRMTDVNLTTWNQVKDILQTAETEGWTVRELVEAYQDEPFLFGKERAKRVTRTEGTTLANGSADVAWKQAGVQKKRWLATLDNVVRPAHARANGQEVEASENFEVGGEYAGYPGDYNLSGSNRINCRCTMIPIEDGGE